MGNWYEVLICRAHQGGYNAKKAKFAKAAIFAENFLEVIDRYKKMPGVKRSFNKGSPFPTITMLSEEDSLNLEKMITFDRRISLNKAKKSWYYISMI